MINANSVIIEQSHNSIQIEQSHNNIQIEALYIWTDYYFHSPAQILPEHKEAET